MIFFLNVFSYVSLFFFLPVQQGRPLARAAPAGDGGGGRGRQGGQGQGTWPSGLPFPIPNNPPPPLYSLYHHNFQKWGGGDISSSSSLNLPPPRSATTFKKCWINAGKGPQPPTVECKTEAQSEYANIAYTFLFLHACCRLVCSVGAKLTKFLRRSSGGSLLRVCCWLGKTSLFFPPHFCT